MDCVRRNSRVGLGLVAVAALASCGPPPRREAPPAGVVEGTYTVEALEGRAVRYLRAGSPESPRVIYVHGTPGDGDGWLAYLERPVPGFEAWAIDRPGFGGSSLVKQAGAGGAGTSGTGIEKDAVVNFAGQAAAIAPLLVRQGGRWPVLVGHSLGGPIVCRVAAEHPDKVSGLVILAGSLDPALEKLEWYNSVADWGALSWMLERSLRVSNREVLAAKMETEGLRPLLPKIACPVVIVHGRKDELVPYANVAYMERELTGAASVRVVELPEAGHFLPWQHEGVVRDVVEGLLLGAPAAPAPASPATGVGPER